MVPLPGELHHPLADMSAWHGGLPTAQVSDEWRGHNRRVQENNPSVHAETDAFRKAGRQRRYRETIMVTTLAPCWYCSGLVRQFRIGAVIVGESVNLSRVWRGYAITVSKSTICMTRRASSSW
jgi:tRNA(Arg) A34 adenosine deaminase TadA